LFIAIILLGMFFLVSEIVDVLSGLNRIYWNCYEQDFWF
jgi:hypothetical protein